jgi:hypothetical protein
MVNNNAPPFSSTITQTTDILVFGVTSTITIESISCLPGTTINTQSDRNILDSRNTPTNISPLHQGLLRHGVLRHNKTLAGY